jgi:hypothetical protein
MAAMAAAAEAALSLADDRRADRPCPAGFSLFALPSPWKSAKPRAVSRS